METVVQMKISVATKRTKLCVSQIGTGQEKKQKVAKKGKTRSWVLKKKEQMRSKGNVVPADTKEGSFLIIFVACLSILFNRIFTLTRSHHILLRILRLCNV